MSQHGPPTAVRCVIARPISAAYDGPPANSPAAPDPRQTARRRSLCSSANYCTIPPKRESSVSLSTLADYRERVGRRHVLTRRDVEGTVEFIADPPLRGSFRCRPLCCDQVPERAGALLLELLTRHPTWRRTRFALFLTCTDVTTRDHGPGVAQASLRSGLTARGALHQCLDVDRWQSCRSFGSRVLMPRGLTDRRRSAFRRRP